jgi:hypothetical protein
VNLEIFKSRTAQDGHRRRSFRCILVVNRASRPFTTTAPARFVPHRYNRCQFFRRTKLPSSAEQLQTARDELFGRSTKTRLRQCVEHSLSENTSRPVPHYIPFLAVAAVAADAAVACSACGWECVWPQASITLHPVRKDVFFASFHTATRRFAKTGSGQTEEIEGKGVFCRSSPRRFVS